MPNTRAALTLVLLLGVAAPACGTSSGGAITSPSAAQSPSQLATKVAGLDAGDCTGQPSGRVTQPMGDHRLTIQVPAGWVDTSATVASNGTLLLQLTAPASYRDAPTTFQLQSLLGSVTGSSSREQAQQSAAQDLKNPKPPAIGPILDCTIAGQLAAFFVVNTGRSIEIDFYLLHANFVYLVRINANGGIDPKAVTDIKAMLGSLAFGL